MVDIARSSDVVRKKKIRRALYGGAALLVIILITVGVSRLKPAAPACGRATVVDPPPPPTPEEGSRFGSARVPGPSCRNRSLDSRNHTGRVEKILLRPART